MFVKLTFSSHNDICSKTIRKKYSVSIQLLTPTSLLPSLLLLSFPEFPPFFHSSLCVLNHSKCVPHTLHPKPSPAPSRPTKQHSSVHLPQLPASFPSFQVCPILVFTPCPSLFITQSSFPYLLCTQYRVCTHTHAHKQFPYL